MSLSSMTERFVALGKGHARVTHESGAGTSGRWDWALVWNGLSRHPGDYRVRRARP